MRRRSHFAAWTWVVVVGILAWLVLLIYLMDQAAQA